jgi:hypothetical protein
MNFVVIVAVVHKPQGEKYTDPLSPNLESGLSRFKGGSRPYLKDTLQHK